MKLLTFTLTIFCVFNSALAKRGMNGGLKCAYCTMFVARFQQKAFIDTTESAIRSDNFCRQFEDEELEDICILLHTGFTWIAGNQNTLQYMTPDVICYIIGACHVDLNQRHCHLFPESAIFIEKLQIKIDICKLPGISKVCEFFNDTTRISIDPILDKDEDGFSFIGDKRGAFWKGKDCNDFNPIMYPGAQIHDEDKTLDHNCNGIYGEDEESEKGWEEIFCNGTNSYGLIYIGDELGTYYQIPESWINPKMPIREGFLSLLKIAVNEATWPQYGFFNGYSNTTRPDVFNITVDSLYLRLREHNLCSHSDYQNLAFRGAKASDLALQARTISRTPFDKPAIVLLMIGVNDICDEFTDMDDQCFQCSIESFLDTLESKLAPNSHVIFFSVYNGNDTYSSTAESTHPLGEMSKNVQGKNVHKWFNCLGISPCKGWTTYNKTISAMTTMRAEELSLQLKNISEVSKYDNFQIHYRENPINKAISDWKSKGKEMGEFFNKFDFFYPSQYAQSAIANALWETIKDLNILGEPNINNDKIRRHFKEFRN